MLSIHCSTCLFALILIGSRSGPPLFANASHATTGQDRVFELLERASKEGDKLNVSIFDELASLQAPKSPLSRSLVGLADGMFFNLIFFPGNAKSWKKKLTELDKPTRADSLEHVSKQGAGGGAAVYGAQAIRRLNSTRLNPSHCISIGSRSNLLPTLAFDSGGTYREVL